MYNKNIIFLMPFDESKGSAIAYDYSRSRADGIVTGANFVSGKYGNAISFSGNDTCEVSKKVFPNLNAEFSIIAWVQGRQAECGSPSKMIWNLNFTGLNNYVEIPIAVKPGSWLSLAVTRRGGIFNFYVNSSLIKTVNKSDALRGISLNQDYYGGDYGFGLLDDVKIFDVALTQQEIINSFSALPHQSYTIDGIDFRNFGVFVSGSDGILSRPRQKAPASLSWDNYHGERIDLLHKFYEPREITLNCFIKASTKMEFIKKVSDFEAQFDKRGTNRLVIDIHPIKPLIYEVYCKDAIEIQKEWSDDLMVGTFKLKLVEPEPVKRVLKHIRVSEATKTCSITLTSGKYLNVYWGDGKADYDVCGTDVTITHDYQNDGDFFPVITGCIEEITNFQTNAIVVWERI